MGGLPNRLEAADIWRGIWYAEAHHSTAIEGNTLVLRQVEALLAEGKAVGNKQLGEYLEVRGYADAADWVYGQAIDPTTQHKDVINLTEIRHIHRMALGPLWEALPPDDALPEETPGSFRRHEIAAFDGGMKPPSWIEVDALMQDWLRPANEIEAGTLGTAEELAVSHCEFERIHPFLDGNGRVGRLVLNLMLVRMGYPPAIIYKNQRGAYLRALQRADSGDPGALGEFIARAILDNLYKFVVPAVAGPARLVPLAALASHRISLEALRVAAARGRLQAAKGPDGQWRSSRNWVDEYLASRGQRTA
jgi:Fic family protein